MKRNRKKYFLLWIGILLAGLFRVNPLVAQVPTCGSNVPYFFVDLRGNPEATWQSTGIVREGQCCGVSSPIRCISFEVMLDSNAVGVTFSIIDGALPPGALFYQVGCGPQTPVDSTLCLSGPGPHYLTFCKPGSNLNIYQIASVSKPVFPESDSTRIGCTEQIVTYGLDSSTVTWNSINPGAPGAYNHFLSDTIGKSSPWFTPDTTAPFFIDYQVCGQPVADECGYTFTVCDTVRIYTFPQLDISVIPNPAEYCASGSGITLTGIPAGGDSVYSYIWRDPSNNLVGSTSTYFAGAPGIYTVELGDGLSSETCPSANLSVPVSVTPDPIVTIAAVDTICPVSPVVALSGTITNATGGTWSGGAGTFAPSNTSLSPTYTPTPAEISAGSLWLYLTSSTAGSCPAVVDSVRLIFGDTLDVTLSAPALSCFGDSATISTTIISGNGNYSYLWGTGDTTSTLFTGSDVWCVTVTDGLGCTTSPCYNLTQPPQLSAVLTSTDATTLGGSDGTANASPAGGTGPYSHSWSNGATSASLTGLALGVYTDTITDANGCQYIASTVVNDPRCAGFQAFVSGSTVDCYGAATGHAQVDSIAGGIGPYTYSWKNPPSTFDSVGGIKAGTYTVIVRDAQGCSFQDDAVVTEPPAMNNTITHIDNAVIGGTAGSATTFPSGGIPPYNYLWSTGGTTQTINNLAAGMYYVTVSDSNSCALVDSVYISEPPCNALDVNIISSDVSCAGGSDGYAIAVPVGAVPPVNYLWSTGSTIDSIGGLSAGSYSISVTDSLNCTNFNSINIIQPSALSIGLVPTPVRCFGGFDGTIDLTVTGGTPPFQFIWNTLSVSEDLIGQKAGSYSVTVTDANGCTISGSTTITQPPLLKVPGIVTPVTCNDYSDGAVDITPTGGLGTYTYLWSNGATTQDLINIPSDPYSVTVTDLNNCTVEGIFLVDHPDSVYIDSILNPCPVPGDTFGTVTVFVSGGNSGPYQLSYNNGAGYLAPGDYVENLPLDSTYLVIARDPNGCISDTFSLNMLPQVGIGAVAFANCHPTGSNTTLVTLTPNGGDGGPYQVSFDNGSSFLIPGDYDSTLTIGNTYQLIVRDGRGCGSDTTSIVIPDSMSTSVTSNTFLGGFNVSCNGLNDGNADLTVSGGSGVYTYAWSNGAVTEDLTNIPAGTYSVTVTDGNGCIRVDSITLTEPAPLATSLTSPTFNSGSNISCAGASDGSIDLTVTGGNTGYSFAWSNGGTTEDISGLAGGTYTVVVTDTNGCTITDSITLTEPTPVTTGITSPTFIGGYNISCNGAADGSTDLTVTGGSPSYTYLWSNAATTEDLVNLGPGTYTVVVTDTNGCSATDSITLTEPAPLATTLTSPTFNSGSNISCAGASDGSIDLTVTGGNTGYSFAWSNGGTTEDISGLAGGTYSVVVTDTNGCTITDSITLTEPTPVVTGITSPTFIGGYNISCNGAADGSTDLTVTGGSPSYTYLWSNAATTEDLTNLGPGTYTVVVTDTNGCTATDSITLTEPAPLATTLTSPTFNSGSNISCAGASDGSIDLTVTGGNTGYSFAWSNGATTEDISGLAGGSYTVVVTDTNGCTITDSITLTEPTPVVTGIISPTFIGGYNISCNGAADGSTDLTVTGGSPSYTYLWSNAATTEDLANLGPGTYTVVVTDTNGCSATDSITLTEPAPLATSLTSPTFNSGSNISCAGASDGSIDLTITGGNTGYSFAWSNGGTTEDITGLAGGTYTVVVTDTNGCTITDSITLTEPTPVVTGITSPTFIGGYNISCNGAADGSTDLTVTGGSPSYTYLWSNAATTEDLTNLGPGTYTVVVTDTNGCSATDSITLTEPAPLATTLTSPTFNSGSNISCAGASDGSIDLTITGGNTGYSFAWSNGGTTEDISGLAGGTYTVVVTDTNGCTITDSISLTEPTPVTTGITSPTFIGGYNISCNGAADGSTDLTVTGGSPSYTYLWSNAATTEDLTNLGPGTYTVVVTDTNGCTATDSITLTEPASLATTLTSPTFNSGSNISCAGASDGSIDLTVAGGNIGYSFAWSNAATTEDISGLAGGTYSVVVTDTNGCTITDSITLTEPTQVVTGITSPTFIGGYNISCNGAADGSTDLTVTGGSPSYTYLWSNAATTEDLANLGPGTYTVVVTDTNGCSATDSITLTEPAPLATTLTSPTFNSGSNISCAGASDGSIDLTVTGGNTGYSFAWSNAATTEDLTNLGPGTYTVVVTDTNGCTITDSITLTEPTPVVTGITSPTFIGGYNISCNGAADGSTDLTVTGGSPSYTYLWSNAATTEDLTNLWPGTYTVVVTDTNGCSATDSITLTEPAPLATTLTSPTFNSGSNISCAGASDGSIDLTVTGGNTGYSFAWSNGGTTEDISGLAGGTYTVVVTDTNGCTISDSITLTEPTPVVTGITSPTFIGGYNISCNGAADGSTDLTVTGGSPSFTYLWSNAATTEDLTNLGPGTYTVVVTDTNGCTATDSITLTEPAPLATTLTSPTLNSGSNISCAGASDGIIDLTITGGNTGYSFAWSNGGTTEDISGLAGGTYTVVITDTNGCTISDSITLTEPTPVVTGITSPTFIGGYNISCNGAADGSTDLTVTGGSPSYTYLWSNAATSEDLTNLGPGTFTVVVTDTNGCSATDSITLTEPAPLALSLSAGTFPSGSNISCFGSSDGSVTSTVTGGNPGYSYTWSNSSTTPNISGLPVGTYSVLVTDTNGCTTGDSISLSGPSAGLSIVLSITDSINCNGGSDGDIDLTVSGGSAPYAYLWSNSATTQDLVNIPAGTYTVVVTDTNGCTVADSIQITEPTSLNSLLASPTSSGGTQISCYGGADGSVDLTASGGTTPYSFIWSNGATTEDLTGLTAGTYVVTITDAQGCMLSDTITLTEPAAPLSITTYNISSVACNGNATGAIDIEVAGGSAPYTYTWSTGATSQDISGLIAGIYSVVITDTNGCSLTDSFTVNQSALLGDSIVVSQFPGGTNISCFGETDGSINLWVFGGTTPYSYSWSNGATTQNLSNIGAGTYSVTVTDTLGCSVVDSATLTGPAQPLQSVLGITNPILCNGDGTGEIYATVSGGTGPYQYVWSNGATTPLVTNLSGGFYSVQVTDTNGCQVGDTIFLQEPDSIRFNGIVTDAACGGSNSGSIRTNVAGGTPYYAFNWSTGAVSEHIDSLAPGTYTVTITDLFGCTQTDTFVVGEAPTLSLSVSVTPPTCYGDTNGIVDLTRNGGSPGFLYMWDNGAMTEDLIGVGAGTYTVMVIDTFGCSDTLSAVVTQPDQIIADAGMDITTCDESVSLAANLPGPLQTGTWSLLSGPGYIVSPNSNSSEFIEFDQGGSILVWTISDGSCAASDTLQVWHDDIANCGPLQMPTGFTPNGDGDNDYFVVKGIYFYPDNRLTIYNRWGNVVYTRNNYKNEWNGENASGEPLPDGTYFPILEILSDGQVLKGYVDLRR